MSSLELELARLGVTDAHDGRVVDSTAGLGGSDSSPGSETAQSGLMDAFYPAEAVLAVAEKEPLPRHLQYKQMSTAVRRQLLLRLAMKGLSAKDAAPLVGCSVACARMVYADPVFRRDVDKMVQGAFADIDSRFIEKKKTLHERLEEQAEESFSDLVNMLRDENLLPSLRVKINQDFLNRSQQTMAQTQVNHAKMTPEMLIRAASVAREIEGNVITINREEVA